MKTAIIKKSGSMIAINLLPPEVFLGAGIKKFLLFFLIILTGCIVLNLICEKKIYMLSTEFDNIEKEMVSYTSIIEEISDIEKKREYISIMGDIITDLTLNRFATVNILKSISSNIIGQKMWLTHLKTDNNRVDIKGVVIDNKTAADFMKRLETSADFSSVYLKKLKRTGMYEDLNFKTFEIFCSLRKSQDDEKNTE